MDEEVFGNIEKIMKKIKPFIAIAVLIFIVISAFNLIEYNKLQKEVKETCGYQQGEDVYCICDKSIVSNIYTSNNPYFISPEDSGLFNLSEEKGES